MSMIPERSDGDVREAATDEILSVAAQRQEHADQSEASADQTFADADQTASDADQAAAEADQESSDSDQHAADRDQAVADWEIRHTPGSDATARAHRRSQQERAASAVDRKGASRARARATDARSAGAVDRDEVATARDRTAAVRDLTARARDTAARRRDRAAEARERHAAQTGDLDEALATLQELRFRGEALRRRGAQERAAAAADRLAAAADRRRAALDRKRAGLDELTGVFRRGAGELALSHEIDRCRRAGVPLVLAMVDVDAFKDVNDIDGHAAGDALLRDLAGAITKAMRSYDVTVRWGGDEFVCALSNVTVDVARQRVAVVAGELGPDHHAVTISFGLARLDDDGRSDTLEALVARADGALLQAKRTRKRR